MSDQKIPTATSAGDRPKVIVHESNTSPNSWVKDAFDGYCVEGDRCVCGGDTPGVRAGCGNWRRPAAKGAGGLQSVPPETNDFNQRDFYADPAPRTDVCKYIEAEKRLADLKGWTGIVRANDTLLGTPPGGSPHSRGQAIVPAWARRWIDCGPLMVEHECYPVEISYGQIIIRGRGLPSGTPIVAVSRHSSKDAAVMYAIVGAAIAKLLSETGK